MNGAKGQTYCLWYFAKRPTVFKYICFQVSMPRIALVQSQPGSKSMLNWGGKHILCMLVWACRHWEYF